MTPLRERAPSGTAFSPAKESGVCRSESGTSRTASQASPVECPSGPRARLSGRDYGWPRGGWRRPINPADAVQSAGRLAKPPPTLHNDRLEDNLVWPLDYQFNAHSQCQPIPSQTSVIPALQIIAAAPRRHWYIGAFIAPAAATKTHWRRPCNVAGRHDESRSRKSQKSEAA